MHSGIKASVKLTLIVILQIALSFPSLTVAQTLEEGKAAYNAKDFTQAMAILKPLAEGGNSEAQVTVGIMYDYGQGVEKNPQEAFKWYKTRRRTGHPGGSA